MVQLPLDLLETVMILITEGMIWIRLDQLEVVLLVLVATLPANEDQKMAIGEMAKMGLPAAVVPWEQMDNLMVLEDQLLVELFNQVMIDLLMEDHKVEEVESTVLLMVMDHKLVLVEVEVGLEPLVAPVMKIQMLRVLQKLIIEVVEVLRETMVILKIVTVQLHGVPEVASPKKRRQGGEVMTAPLVLL